MNSDVILILAREIIDIINFFDNDTCSKIQREFELVQSGGLIENNFLVQYVDKGFCTQMKILKSLFELFIEKYSKSQIKNTEKQDLFSSIKSTYETIMSSNMGKELIFGKENDYDKNRKEHAIKSIMNMPVSQFISDFKDKKNNINNDYFESQADKIINKNNRNIYKFIGQFRAFVTFFKLFENLFLEHNLEKKEDSIVTQMNSDRKVVQDLIKWFFPDGRIPEKNQLGIYENHIPVEKDDSEFSIIDTINNFIDFIFEIFGLEKEKKQETPTERLQQPPTDGLQQQLTDRSQQPSTDGLQQPPTDRSQQPPTDGSQQPPTDGLQQPPTDGSQQPPTDGSQQQLTDGSQQQLTDGSKLLLTVGSQQPPTDGLQQQLTDRSQQPPTDFVVSTGNLDKRQQPYVPGTVKRINSIPSTYRSMPDELESESAETQIILNKTQLQGSDVTDTSSVKEPISQPENQSIITNIGEADKNFAQNTGINNIVETATSEVGQSVGKSPFMIGGKRFENDGKYYMKLKKIEAKMRILNKQ